MLLNSRAGRDRVSALLLLAALFQAHLPLLTLPLFVEKAPGEVVLLCTLQGLKQIQVDSGPDAPPESHFSGVDCPVCLHNQPSHAPVPAVRAMLRTAWTLLRVGPVDVSEKHTEHLTSAGFRIRAPPLS